MKRKTSLQVIEIAVFAMLGALMFLTKFLMQALPNIHLLGLFIIAITLVYRWKALAPLYVYVLIDGVVGGFAGWWLPYLYVFLPLWGAIMLLQKPVARLQKKAQTVIYMVICALHGLVFGMLYAPVQALMYGLSFKAMLAWIVAGLPFDAIHAAGNFAAASLAIPLAALMTKMQGQGSKQHGPQSGAAPLRSNLAAAEPTSL